MKRRPSEHPTHKLLFYWVMHDFDDDNRGKFSRERQTMRSDMGDRNRYSTGSMCTKHGPPRRDDGPQLKRS
ncbi:hypothetical protein M3Y98_01061700 [Aphelenchoides besseyi]|nr:hypothetical protein M3Y98_01061700 [Aphelenchoides besseyi]KAI6209694.1 hypothetical protein M3Y96_00248000 [Aphelenchoides besseyi]